MKSKGVLEDKLKTYYAESNSSSYVELLNQALSHYDGDKFNRVLDIGCGVGTLQDSIKGLKYKVFGLEASDYGVKECQRKGYSCEKFFLKKGVKLPFEDDFFSFVNMNQVIEHISKEDGKYYLQEIIRVLEPGGVAIIQSPSHYTRIWRTDPHHVYCWKPNELRDEVDKYSSQLSKIKSPRVVLEFWMARDYNEDIINYWHKYNRRPVLKRLLYLINKGLDKLFFIPFDSDRLLAAANVTFVKKRK